MPKEIRKIIKLSNIPFENNSPLIRDMATATIDMVNGSVAAFVQRDLDLAKAIIDYDDVVDELFNTLKNELITEIGNRKNIAEVENFGEFAVDMLMVAKYFERIGDHAVNIAEWVEYAITGHHKDITE